MNLCELRGVSKDYQRAGQRVAALQDFSLALRPGEVSGLLGPNGAGKTTALKVLLSLTHADRGGLWWRGEPVRDQRYLGRIGALLEGRGALNERLSTWENARYFCALREVPFDIDHWMTLVSLLELPDPAAPVRLLSTGNKLRSALLLSVIHKPELVLLDEPTIGLDMFGTEQIERLVRILASRGTTVLLSSHDLAFVERASQRIVCIRQGQKVFDGAKQDFLKVDHAYELEVLCGPAGLPAPELSWRQADNGSARLRLQDHAALCNTMEQLMPTLSSAVGLQIHRVTLRQKYRELVGLADE